MLLSIMGTIVGLAAGLVVYFSVGYDSNHVTLFSGSLYFYLSNISIVSLRLCKVVRNVFAIIRRRKKERYNGGERRCENVKSGI